MKWMVICFFITTCSNEDVETTASYITKEECVARTDKENIDLASSKASGFRRYIRNYRCVEIQP